MPISQLSFQVIHAKIRSQWITLFEIASQWSTSQAYWVTLALISNIANYLKYNYFWDYDGIDNVTLRLSKFSDFCSRHIVGVAGDDIMFHILVDKCRHYHFLADTCTHIRKYCFDVTNAYTHNIYFITLPRVRGMCGGQSELNVWSTSCIIHCSALRNRMPNWNVY